ncbi:MAG TPA: 5-oxoprolinase subunit PxpB [Opitutaceae bacterium]|nr:5-oxoprolinase subunit PxpB [Opitutaceae bacterium]
MIFASPRIEPLGESAFLVRVGNDVTLKTNALAVETAAALRRVLPLRIEVVPAFATVGVIFNPATDGRVTVESLITEAIRNPQPLAPKPARRPAIIRIPVSYDGPDIDAVGAKLRLKRKELIKLHTGTVYTVMMLGFAPGFAYLGPLSPKLVLPRRPEPRRHVQPGSVAIAGAHTAVYPLDTPGGWHLIGRTNVVMFDPNRTPTAFLHAGDQVVFEKE